MSASGSLAHITGRSHHVRFTPDSGHSSVRVGCPKSARSGHYARNSTTADQHHACRPPFEIGDLREARDVGIGGLLLSTSNEVTIGAELFSQSSADRVSDRDTVR
jgi:hypothetical protein